MQAVLDISALLLGSALVIVVLGSAVRTVLVPGSERPLLTTVVVVTLHQVFRALGRRAADDAGRERVLARFAPITLLALPLVWSVGVIIGFSLMYWGLGVRGDETFLFSGSSLLTLGFSRPSERPAQILAFAEAFIGLVLVALLISFLPTIYSLYSNREKAVSRLAVRAGSPPDVIEMLGRAQRLDVLERLTGMWEEWADWMLDVEESHTSFPFLVWFRSSVPGRSWITSAGAALDMAAIWTSALAVPDQQQAQLFMRTGYLALRRVADYFDIPYDPEPRPTDPISVTRDEFDEVYERLARMGLPMKPDREQAWKDFAGWRVNYDRPLLGLCGVVEPPAARWSSDRSVPTRVPLRLSASNRGITRLRRRQGRTSTNAAG